MKSAKPMFNTGEGKATLIPSEILNQLPHRPTQILVWGEADSSWADLGLRTTYAELTPNRIWAQVPSLYRQGLLEAEMPRNEPSTPWDLVVVNGVTPEIHPLTLWNALASRLHAGASVVLIRELSPDGRMLTWFDHLQDIGIRCGFQRLNKAEGSHESSPNDHRFRLFRKNEVPPRWTIRHVKTDDVPGIADLFYEVFKQTLSREMWIWKYSGGQGNAVIATRNGKVIAHYGGIYRDILINGQSDWAFQICDVMVHPNERGVMTRQGPFFLTAATGAEIYGPYGFGFPNARAMQVAEKMALYAPVGTMATITWNPGSTRIRVATRLRIIRKESLSDELLVEELWKQMSCDLQDAVVGYRNWDYIKRRYFDHPQYHYDVVGVLSRLSNKPMGVLVMRTIDEKIELMDIVAPMRNIPVLVDQVRRLTGLWKKKTVYCWITNNRAKHFLVHGAKLSNLDVSIPTSVWTKDPRARVFENKWWLMSGDTDFR